MPYEKQQTTEQPVTNHKLLNRERVYRGYNALVAALVMYEYVNNSEAAAIEYLPDIAIHAFEAIAPNSLNDLAAGVNIARGIQAGIAFFSGKSTIPRDANFGDIFNHGFNACWRLS